MGNRNSIHVHVDGSTIGLHVLRSIGAARRAEDSVGLRSPMDLLACAGELARAAGEGRGGDCGHTIATMCRHFHELREKGRGLDWVACTDGPLSGRASGQWRVCGRTIATTCHSFQAYTGVHRLTCQLVRVSVLA